MKTRTIITFVAIFAFCFVSMSAQGGQMQISKNPMQGGASPVGQSYGMEVLTPGGIYFDINIRNKTSNLYLGNEPVYSFRVRIVNTRMRRGLKLREFVLTGNTDQRIIIDRFQGKVFLKVKKGNRGVKKMVISNITAESLSNGILRVHMRDDANLGFYLNQANGQLSTTVSFQGHPIFVMATSYDMVQGRQNLNVLRMKGNVGGGIYYNRARKQLYFKSPKNKGVWTGIKRR